jgi:hypothetical protein
LVEQQFSEQDSRPEHLVLGRTSRRTSVEILKRLKE